MKRLFGKIAISALLTMPLIFAANFASAGCNGNGCNGNYGGWRGGGCANGRCFDAAARNLIDKVVAANAGWDWEPRCAGGAHWSWKEMRCKGGTGKHKHCRKRNCH
jgi:hypothetical protein